MGAVGAAAMAPVRYSLHYEDYSEQLMSRFGKLLQMQSLVDMTLMCSSHTLRVHKAVLAASSAYFQEVLQKQTGEPLVILKMRFSVLKSLVEFMYSGRTNCLEENLDELVSAAQFLKIKGLSKVTKEGLGITNRDELPVFPTPVVIDRPAASLIGHPNAITQDSCVPKQSASQVAMSGFPSSVDPISRPMKDIESTLPTHQVLRQSQDGVVRIPFEIDPGVMGSGAGHMAGLGPKQMYQTSEAGQMGPSTKQMYQGSAAGQMGPSMKQMYQSSAAVQMGPSSKQMYQSSAAGQMGPSAKQMYQSSGAGQMPPCMQMYQGSGAGQMAPYPKQMYQGSGSRPTSKQQIYQESLRSFKPRRGRPIKRGSRGPGEPWERQGVPARTNERSMMRREHDPHHSVPQKHLQNMQMQDYMDRVTLSQAVESICGPDSSSSSNYMNDLMYMDQSITKNTYNLDQSMQYKNSSASETITSDFMPKPSQTETDSTGINSAMSQYVNALKNAGLPTDLPILFESDDGSYMNVNEQVLLDMVQSGEIQYEVIDQPNLIDNVSDPGEIKSIDDLSKSIERGEMLLNTKSFVSASNFGKVNFDKDESLNAILPEIQDSFPEPPNYGHGNDHENPPDFTCMDGDLQFFSNNDVKKYYEDQKLDDPSVIGQICPTTSVLDTNFNISLLNTNKGNIDSHFNLNTDTIDLRKTDCFDFGLPIPQSSNFKEDTLESLMSTAAENASQSVEANEEITLSDKNSDLEELPKTDDERYRDMINMERSADLNTPKRVNLNEEQFKIGTDEKKDCITKSLNVDIAFEPDSVISPVKKDTLPDLKLCDEAQFDAKPKDYDIIKTSATENPKDIVAIEQEAFGKAVEDIIDNIKNCTDETAKLDINFDDVVRMTINNLDDENNQGQELGAENNLQEEKHENNTGAISVPETRENNDTVKINITNDNDIPFAVGLLPLKEVQNVQKNYENISDSLKRKVGIDSMDNVDKKCLKRKVKYKKVDNKL